MLLTSDLNKGIEFIELLMKLDDAKNKILENIIRIETMKSNLNNLI
jgi:hypothetical protein